MGHGSPSTHANTTQKTKRRSVNSLIITFDPVLTEPATHTQVTLDAGELPTPPLLLYFPLAAVILVFVSMSCCSIPYVPFAAFAARRRVHEPYFTCRVHTLAHTRDPLLMF
jgi:hypothetical protein